MPHECTGCGRQFDDGSKKMLTGCPDCGGKKFQFRPAGPNELPHEDAAQAAARSDVVDGEFLAESSPTDLPPDLEETEDPPERTPKDLAELREELDDQFESIKIVEPGQYELNLMELYDRETYIISLQEDGRYVIDVPESWHETANTS